MTDLRFPNITGTTPLQQMSQMQSYMHQMVTQLNIALKNIDDATQGNTKNVQLIQENQDKPITPEQALKTFNGIKSLIIKSAEIVEAYEEKLSQIFKGTYIAKSDFGTYKNDIINTITQGPDGTSQRFSEQQEVLDSINDILIDINAHIKTGKLYEDKNGLAVYGVEVGQTTKGTVNGEEVEIFSRFSRFTSEGLFLYDGVNDTPVAYITGKKLYITNAYITGELGLGGYFCDLTNGVAFKWKG